MSEMSSVTSISPLVVSTQVTNTAFFFFLHKNLAGVLQHFIIIPHYMKPLC